MTRAAAADPLAAVAASAAGERLLSVLRSPTAETRRDGRRGPSLAGPIPGVALTGDALVDLLDGRDPLRFELTRPGAAAPLARELRARLRGQVLRRDWRDVAALRALDGVPLRVRLLSGAAPSDDAAGAWADPVLTARAARLTLDGRIEDPSGDLAARRVRLIDPDGFRRRPAALLHLARLGSRPGWTIEPATRDAARAACAAGALAAAPVLHLGDALDLLAATPELPQALTLLQQLAPAVPLADGVEVDEPRLRAAVAVAPAGAHVEAVLRALAPAAPRKRIAAFLTGARLDPASRHASVENGAA